MAAKQRTYSFHLVILLLAICWPMLFTYLKYKKKESPEDITYNKPNLTGLVISDQKPELNKENWFSGSYQEETEDYNNDHWSLKEFMVRWNNQMYYDMFHQIRVNGFVIGKEDYVFSESYIFSAFGDDQVNESKIKELLRKAKVIQDTLKRKGIDLFLAFAPGKGVMCREFVQDKYVHPVSTTNLSLFQQYSKQYGLNHLDLAEYFTKLKATSPYPLFPKFGHHWSHYAECLAVDTIIGYIEKLHHCDLPDITWSKVDVVDTAQHRDADVLKSMNLLRNPAQNMKLAYPEVLFESDSIKNRTRVLTVSDSYWYGPVYMGVPASVFAGGQFWYYCNKVVPSPKPGEKVEVWELDLKKEIESNQVIMLLYSDGNLSAFGNNFIPDVYEMYTAPTAYKTRMEKYKNIQFYAKDIRNNPGFLKKATQKSKDLMIPLDSAIRLDAMKMAGYLN